MSKTRRRKVEQRRLTLTCCPETKRFDMFLLRFRCGVEEAGDLGSFVGTGSERSELVGRDGPAIVQGPRYRLADGTGTCFVSFFSLGRGTPNVPVNRYSPVAR